MLTRAKKAVQTAAVVALGGLSVWTVAAERVRPGGTQAAQLFRYQQPGGESFFALAIRPDGLAAGPARDHVVLIDTSASQVGQHRRQALAVVRELLTALPQSDRVRLYAVDSTLEALQDSFSQPQSAEVEQALSKLSKRVPLGASDLRPALEASLETLAKERAGSIIYVGDGMSTAGILQTEEMRGLVARLRERQVPVHSYAVGPRIDHRLLGVLAQHTGGVLMLDELIDDNRVSPAELGGRLAQAATAAVLYPESITVTPAVDRLLPVDCPPLRPDRDSILLGRGETAEQVKVTATVGGRILEWTVQPSASQRGNTYLSRLWAVAESDEGLSVAVAGTELLHQALEEFERDVAVLTAAGQRAIQTRNLKQAEEIAWAIRQADPENTQADHLIDASQKLRAKIKTVQFAPPAPGVGNAVPPPPAGVNPPLPSGVNPPPVPGSVAPPPLPGQILNNPPPLPPGGVISGPTNNGFVPGLPIEYPQGSIGGGAVEGTAREGDIVDEEVEAKRIRGQQLNTLVKNTIKEIDRTKKANPEDGLKNLKRLLTSINSSTDIDANDRESNRLRIQQKIDELTTLQQKVELQRITALERQAQLEAQRLTADQLVLRDERLTSLIEKVRALMNEGNAGNEQAFEQAELVARTTIEVAPYNGVSWQSIFVTEAANQLDRIMRLRLLRSDKFLEALYLVEKAHVPFPDEPPLLYPPPEVWQALTQRRKKWASVDLTKYSPKEEKLREALNQPTDVNFTDQSLKDCIEYLAKARGIDIVIDQNAIDEGGNSADLNEENITLQLNGVTLRSILKLLLNGKDLTWLIEDEVMKITTTEAAEDEGSIKPRVYPVGDLVIPPMMLQSSGGGGFGGGMGGIGGGMGGGGMGGGMGGMGGGMGGMGGGMGGMGGGMGGGMFSVDSVLPPGEFSPVPLKKKPLTNR
jgi:hypothetical protein